MIEFQTALKEMFFSYLLNSGMIFMTIFGSCFLFSLFFQKRIRKSILFGICFVFSFIFSFLIYWAPVWLGLSNSDQYSSWAPIFITVGVFQGFTGALFAILISAVFKGIYSKIKK